ncbi:MAG: glycosyltransferase [Acidimicrobiia bacterium]|nr:glycosyltransferase [Acidimicrobiia bacterium]
MTVEPGSTSGRRAGRGMARPRALLTLADVPVPADSGKRLRAAATLQGLCRVADVDVLVLAPGAPGTGPTLPEGASAVRSAQLDVPLRRRIAAGSTVLVKRVPWQMAVRDWAAARRRLRDWSSLRYDLVWFGAMDHAVCLGPHVAAGRVVVDADDVETAKLAGFLALPPGPGVGVRLERLQRRVELPLWRSIQAELGRRADVVVVCSELDRARFGGPRTAVVPNTYPDLGPARPARRPAGPAVLLVVANFEYEPNADGARFAARDVFGHVRRRLPTAQLRLVGRGAEHLTELSAIDGVHVVGHVEDVGDELARASVALVPVRYGGGTRLKVIEALARGVPVVSTTLGVEGLDVVPGTHLEVADDPEALAQACADLAAGPSGCEAMVLAGRALYERRYRPEVAWEAIERIVCHGSV